MINFLQIYQSFLVKDNVLKDWSFHNLTMYCLDFRVFAVISNFSSSVIYILLSNSFNVSPIHETIYFHDLSLLRNSWQRGN